MRRAGKKVLGFTLVETVLTIVIVAIISTVTAKVLITGLDLYSLIINRTNIGQGMRESMERMFDELVLLRWTDVTWMSGTRLGFVDRQGVSTSFRSRTVNSYPCLYRDDDYMMMNVTSLDFDYFKSDNSAASFSWQLKRIKVDFTATDPAGFGSVHLRTEVFPRSFMYTDFE